MKKVLYIFVCLSFIALNFSCKSSRKAVSGEVDTEIKQPVEKRSVEKNRYEQALAGVYDFKFLQAKTKYSLGNKSLSGKLNVEHGKRLCMTVAVLGIEVARIEANTKTVVLVDKFDKIYSELSIEEFAEKFGLQDELQYDALESLILGRLFVPGDGEAKKGDFKKLSWNIDDKDLLIGTIAKEKYSLSYIIGADNKLSSTKLKVNRKGSESTVNWQYSGYQQIEGGDFVTSETLSLNAPEMKLNATLTLSSPSVSAKSWISFNPSESYRKVTPKELINAIKNLKN